MRDRSSALLLSLLLLFGCQAVRTDEVRVEVVGLRSDSLGNLVLLLEDPAGERLLPIWIGIAEAQSIATQLESIELPRPNTHDLATRILDGLGGTLERVVVTELRDNTYFAILVGGRAGERFEIDSRPSDAIAIALRAQIPIFVREQVLERASRESSLEAPVERVPL